MVDMEVEKESGELVVSKLQVPNQPSFPLQNFIHNVMTCLALTFPPKYLLYMWWFIVNIKLISNISTLDLFKKKPFICALNGY